ncbi:family A G protein-coupled receptor-like protein [Conidiobolus coronatus NRRL 28638]|uniref:Family A G protein-coupled receptor-like protein n=1 Tax=Conidiobolus coronatus (strain ATCC 28846 / CBS 209.66 / NRRL 28638) TaxID=796925 RepID=A0A137PG92_CONC2|nr:family A G protein-coupled receptor-like protein [Conidiobolus coronatus NRRL 28638]|eukprot:KXN74012.1 family A G protein-coupled receptor-like protein [Conidiobolus coronatus NRRL 28638]
MAKPEFTTEINGPMVIGFGVVMCAIAVLAFVFNSSILYVLSKRKKLRGTTGSNFIIFNSCIDLIFDVCICIYSLILICSGFRLVRTQLCPAFTGLMFCCLLLNLLGVTFLGVARYLAIIKKKTLSQTTWALILILPCSWVIGTTAFMFGTDHWAYTSSGVMCFPKPDKSNPYNLFFYISLTIWAFFELCTLTFCYSSIIFYNEKNVAKMKEYDSQLNSSGGSNASSSNNNNNPALILNQDHEEKASDAITITESIPTSESHELTPHNAEQHHSNPQIKNLRLVSLKLMSILVIYYLSYIPFVIYELVELTTGKYKSPLMDLVFDLSKTLCTFTCPLISIYLHKPLKLELIFFAKKVGLKSAKILFN